MGNTKKFKDKPKYSLSGPASPPSSVPEKLETAYATLRVRYEGLDQELTKANKILVDKNRELNFFTEYLNSILSHISQGILFINASGVITTYNPAAEAVLCKPQKDVLFLDFWHSFSDILFGFSIKKVLQERKGPPVQTIEVEFEKGNPKTLEIIATFVIKEREEEQDSIEGLIVLVKDITEFRRLEMTAQRNLCLNALGEMASMVAHEIRNPLGGIKGFAALLERDLADRPDLQRMASYITKGTDNLNNTVTRILNYTRPLKLQFKETDLVILLNDLKSHLKTDEQMGAKTIVFENHETTLLAPIDAESTRSMLFNLVLNSVQAMPKGGTVTLKLYKKQEDAVIEVQDTGIGIPPENLKKIFSPLFTTKPEGNGFGLAEVQKTIQAHEGSISVESQVGQGTIFTIKLPLKRKVQQ